MPAIPIAAFVKPSRQALPNVSVMITATSMLSSSRSLSNLTSRSVRVDGKKRYAVVSLDI